MEQPAQYVKTYGLSPAQWLPSQRAHALLPPHWGHPGEHLPRHPEGQMVCLVRRQDHPALHPEPARRTRQRQPINTHTAELWGNPTAFKKYLRETYARQVSSREPRTRLPGLSPCAVCIFLSDGLSFP